MKKGQIVELIVRAQQVKPHPLIVEKYLDLVFNQTILPLFVKDPANLDLYSKRIDNIAVTNNMSILPSSTIQFIDSANGVRQVYAPSKKEIKFVPLAEGAFAVFADLEVGQSDPSVGYVQKHDRVYFGDNMPSEITEVTMHVVLPPSALDDYDEFILPVGFDEQQLIAGFLAKVPPEKKSNDNSSNPL